MSDYRRFFVPGGTYFFTIVSNYRRPLFTDERNVQLLREAIADVKRELPFTINAAVVLPDHLHFIWSLPPRDDGYSKRIGLMKVRFTKSLRQNGRSPQEPTSKSRQKHRESDIWQRRFWEHTIEDEEAFDSFFDYIHFNPVRHGLVSCPHRWVASSFHFWVNREIYAPLWGCCCENRVPQMPKNLPSDDLTGEPAE